MAAGTDILSYHGDAELAAGANPGVVGFNPGGDPLEGVNKTLGDVMTYQLALNTAKYQQAIADRDKKHELFATQKIDYPVLDEDRPALEENLGKVKEVLTSPGDINSGDKFYKLQDLLNKQTALKASAKTRYATAAEQRLAAADELNPELKQKRLDFLGQEIKKGVEKPIDPYSKLMTYTPADLAAPAAKTTYQSIVKDGVPYKIATTSPDPQGYTDEVSLDGLLTGEKMDKVYKIKAFYDEQTKNPLVMNPDAIKEANATIDAFNIANKYDKTSKYYAKPLGRINDDGTVSTDITPADFWKSLKVASTWQTTTASPVPDEELMKVKKQQADIVKEDREGRAALTNAAANMKKEQNEGALIEAKKANYFAEAAQHKAAGEKDQEETALLKANASQEVADAFTIFNNESKVQKGYEPVTKVLTKNGKTVDELQKIGIDPTWQARDLGQGTASMRKALATNSLFEYGGDPSLNKANDKITKAVKYPTKVVMLRSPDGDENKQRLVGYDERGNLMNVVDANEAGVNMIRESSGFINDANFQKKSAGYRLMVEDMQGTKDPGFDIRKARTRLHPDHVNLGGSDYLLSGDNLIDPVTSKIIATRGADGKWINK